MADDYFLRSWLCGGVANAVTSALLNPLDVVKTRLQMGHGERSLVSSIHSAWAEKGLWRGLYQPGLSASMIREMMSSGPRAGLYTPVRDFAIKQTGAPSDSLLVKLVSAMVCGIVGSVIANPFDVVKVRLMAAAPTSSPPPTTLSVLRSLHSTEGTAGLYRGLVPSTLRGCFIAAGELGTYDVVKTELRRRYSGPGPGQEGESIWLHITASLVTGVVAAVVASPFDVLKSRFMAGDVDTGVSGSGVGGVGRDSSSSIKGSQRRSVVRAARSLFEQHGYRVFLLGVVPSYLRLGPHALICFPLFERLRALAGLDFI